MKNNSDFHALFTLVSAVDEQRSQARAVAVEEKPVRGVLVGNTFAALAGLADEDGEEDVTVHRGKGRGAAALKTTGSPTVERATSVTAEGSVTEAGAVQTLLEVIAEQTLDPLDPLELVCRGCRRKAILNARSAECALLL